MKTRFFALIIAVAALLAVQANQYWSWGWGDYGAGMVENVALADWSLINFGNVPADQRTVERCNKILELNPDHKFVIRVWPIMGSGKLSNNRYQATIWDYFYRPEVKPVVEEKIRQQINLISEGISKPEAIVGMTYLEELPGPIASFPFGRKLEKNFIPWDMQPFVEQIGEELGHPLDLTSEEDALWWGQKYCQYMNEVHACMRSVKPDAKIIFWLATLYDTLDRDDRQLFDYTVMPIYLEDLLRDGHCDGVFAYPNSELIWQKKTLDLVNKYNCLFFSQTSTPSGMRLSSFDDTVNLALMEHPGNLGSFCYFGRDRNIYAWNIIPEFRGRKKVHVGELQQWFYKNQNVGREVAKSLMKPRLYVSYDFSNRKKGGFVALSAVVYNPRSASSVSVEGDQEWATLRNLEIRLATVPEGYSLPPEANSLPSLQVGTLNGEELVEVLWWLRKETDDTHVDPTQLTVEVAAADLPTFVWRGESVTQSRAVNMHYPIRYSGEKWLTFISGNSKSELCIELESLKHDVSYPTLKIDGEEVCYKGVLEKGNALRIFSGVRARLVRLPLFTEEVCRFKREEGEETRVFDEGYLVYNSPSFIAKPGFTYTLEIDGHVSDGAILNQITEFSGQVNGENKKISVTRYDQLKETPGQISLPVTVPAEFDKKSPIRGIVRFYRHNQEGKLHLKEFDLISPEPLEEDVSDKLDGNLRIEGHSLVRVGYSDRNAANFAQSEMMRFEVINLSEQSAVREAERKGGADF